MRAAAFRLAAAVLALLASAACQVRTDVVVTMVEDGSGSVEVAVTLDEDALERVPEPSTLFATEDLAATGWIVEEPVDLDDGSAVVRVRKPFGTPAEGEQVLGELTGSNGVIDDVSVTVDDGFTTTSYRVRAEIDLGGGLATFSDDALTEALDGEPVGESVEAIEERFAAPIGELLAVRVATDLPGESGDVTVEPVLGGGPVLLEAEGVVTDRSPLVPAAVAAAAATALVVLLTVRARRWRRRRRTTDG